ncbi:MAG: transcription factor S [Candidatus Nitrosotenuis sp.]|jgi:DNA-directed RNA polymerase subunit M|uniref:transcription factor S n=1 Tax=Candidatus Nitrosotenuis cloacae TaxID=1603555 RepID=UPI00228178FD|nr:transcription factor S [Candidatus Nitrosotenuis cloacae]MDC8437487.1 transcription factor S [Candidatus Nitrosotenuis sp.]
MQFCPKCGIRLKKGSCPKCGHSEGEAKQEIKKASDGIDKSFTVLEENDGKETLPTIKIECEKCGHDEAVWWMLQTRSADEPTTQFYRCSSCNHTWRNYA